jgi:hypothetical protein
MLFFIIGQQQQGRPWLRQLPRLLAVLVLGSGLMLNTVRAAWEIFSKPKQAFERTAKFGVERQNHNWMHQRYQLRFDSIVYFELALGFFNLGSAWWAWQMGSWGITIFAGLFGTGLLLVAGTTIFQAVAVYRNRKARQRRTAIERAQLTQELRG